MARDLKVFDVFVASPGDVAEERDRLEEVIKEVNDAWQDRLGVRLNLVRWETHTRPGFGEDAQDVVNQQLPETFDVFVGILWSRIGTPTKRAESGTIEEFDRALAQWKTNPDSIELLMYFKNAPLEMECIDPEQINGVKAFRESLQERGGLYNSFRTPDDFEKVVRNHLQRVVQDLSSAAPVAFDRPAASVSELAVNGSDDDGILDLIDDFTDGFGLVTEIVAKLSESVVQVGEDMTIGQAEVLEASQGGESGKGRETKRAIASIAIRLDVFSETLEAETPALGSAFSNAMAAFEKAIAIAPDFGESGVRNMYANHESIVGFDKTLGETLEVMSDMASNLESIPRVTTRFNRAKRRAVAALQTLCATFASSRNQLQSAVGLLENLGGED